MVFERTKLLDVTGPLQVFNDAKRESGEPAFRTILVSQEGGPIETDAGVVLQTVSFDHCRELSIDTLLVSGGTTALEAAKSSSLRGWLIRQAKDVRRLGSICLGAFILAECGLLDGKRATTHWERCAELADRFPAIDVRPDPIFVLCGDVWTSAGVSAGIDMALAMVEEDLGHTTALAIARELVLYLKRPGGQSQFSTALRQQTRDRVGRFERLHAWIRENPGADLSIPALSSFMAMSPRNFARVYSRENGQTPGRAVEALRVEAARDLLETSRESVQQIAHAVGFGDPETFRRLLQNGSGLLQATTGAALGFIERENLHVVGNSDRVSHNVMAPCAI
ncbi:DJ-1/PfpI family protein [Mesorhizobium sp. CO1-1-4]|nr:MULTISPECIES: DJ-1/PfpI family protein [unclassified Mesorhizobium]MBZ9739654.1 DJ-1/PfpI family protein [Mesorhizobium sp. CO1-1-4]MBZ9805081.1 DJ-1/PfpI family protein [Mesorhizobium sp. ES1-6]